MGEMKNSLNQKDGGYKQRTVRFPVTLFYLNGNGWPLKGHVYGNIFFYFIFFGFLQYKAYIFILFKIMGVNRNFS